MERAASILDRLRIPRRGAGFRRLLNKLEYLPEPQLQVIIDAFQLSASAHEGQRRYSGEPYINHPVAVASILAELRLDHQTIAAALLHDVIEDTAIDKEHLAAQFGDEIAELVDGVSKLDRLSFTSRAEVQIASFRKMMLAMVEDIRVILVKLSDRVHNMQTLEPLPADKKHRIALETLEIYAPIANRLGMNTMKTELEDCGFRYAYPFRYRILDKALRQAQGNQRQIVKRISDRLRRALRAAGIEGSVKGRKKHLYSIYRKMRIKSRSLSEIADVFGFRLIVNNVDDCYRALGTVHQQYKPMPGRFKDYIAIPRVNGYQSLHTTLLGPNGIPIEVQIRTEDMDRVAERGIASHWQYKAVDKEQQPPQVRAREWLASINEMESAGNSEEFMEHVKIDLFPDKVYVFTPKGDILRLPRGATCVDFAYAVHTDVGNKCVGATVDRCRVPLRTRLKNGQMIEIITSKNASPKPDWVNFVVTAKARYSIRQHLKNLRSSEAENLGKRLLDQAMRELGSPLRKVNRTRFKALLDEFSLDSATELYEQLGLGERLAPVVARILLQTPRLDTGETDRLEPITIAGTEGMVVSYGHCCHPIPGDAIMGYLSTGRGVVIHRDICGNLSEFRKQPSKWIAVNWEKDINQDFSAEISVEVINKPGALAEVAARIGDAGSNIEQVSLEEQHEENIDLVFTTLVRDRVHLSRVIRGIRRMSNVNRVTRTCT